MTWGVTIFLYKIVTFIAFLSSFLWICLVEWELGEKLVPWKKSCTTLNGWNVGKIMGCRMPDNLRHVAPTQVASHWKTMDSLQAPLLLRLQKVLGRSSQRSGSPEGQHGFSKGTFPKTIHFRLNDCNLPRIFDSGWWIPSWPLGLGEVVVFGELLLVAT